MNTRPEALLRAARLIEQTVPLFTRATLVGDHYELGFSQRLLPGRVPVMLGDVASLQAARGQLLHAVAVAAERLESLPGWGLLGSRRQAALIAWLEGAGPRGWQGALAVLPSRAIASARTDPRALIVIEHVLAKSARPRDIAAAELWRTESDGELSWKACRDTHLKRAALPAEMLAASGLLPVAAGETVTALAVDAIPGDVHDWFALAGVLGYWAADLRDWELLGDSDAPEEDSPWARHGNLVAPGICAGDLMRFDMRRRPATGSEREQRLLALAEAVAPALEAWGHPVAIVDCDEERGALELAPCDLPVKRFYSWLKRRWSGGLGLDRQAEIVRIDARQSGGFHRRGGVSPVSM